MTNRALVKKNGIVSTTNET